MIRANCYKKQAIRSKNKFDVNFPPFLPKEWIDHVDLHFLIFFMIDSTFQSFDHKNSDSIKKPMIEFLTLSSTNNMLHNQRMLQEQGQTESIHIRCSNICIMYAVKGLISSWLHNTHDYCTVYCWMFGDDILLQSIHMYSSRVSQYVLKLALFDVSADENTTLRWPK